WGVRRVCRGEGKVTGWSGKAKAGRRRAEQAPMKSPARGGAFQRSVVWRSAGDDVHRAALLRAAGGELHLAVGQREQGVVAAKADVDARMELGATLADDDVAGLDGLATIDLDAQHLRVGIATVARGTYAFFMCHGDLSLLAATGNAGDLDFGVVLAMARLLAVMLA